MATVKEVTDEYVKQIIQAATTQDAPEYLIGELLKEYGAKAYHQGRQHLVETMCKLI